MNGCTERGRIRGWSAQKIAISLEQEMAMHSRILAWRIQWTEEPGGLWSMGSQRVRCDWAANSWANVNSEYKPVSEARVFLCSVFVFPQKKCRKHLGKLVCASRIKAYENSHCVLFQTLYLELFPRQQSQLRYCMRTITSLTRVFSMVSFLFCWCAKCLLLQGFVFRMILIAVCLLTPGCLEVKHSGWFAIRAFHLSAWVTESRAGGDWSVCF